MYGWASYTLKIKWPFGYSTMTSNCMLLKSISCVWCGLIFIVPVSYYTNVTKGLLKILKHCWGLHCAWLRSYHAISVLLPTWETDKKDNIYWTNPFEYAQSLKRAWYRFGNKYIILMLTFRSGDNRTEYIDMHIFDKILIHIRLVLHFYIMWNIIY